MPVFIFVMHYQKLHMRRIASRWEKTQAQESLLNKLGFALTIYMRPDILLIAQVVLI